MHFSDCSYSYMHFLNLAIDGRKWLYPPAALPLLQDLAVTPWEEGGLGSRTGLNGCGKGMCRAPAGNRTKVTYSSHT